MAFYELEPFGYEIEMLGNATVACTIANRFRGKDEKEHKIEDFMPLLRKYSDQAVEDQVGIVEMFNIALGGEDLRKSK